MPVAANIDEVIEFAALDVGQTAWIGALDFTALLAALDNWIAGMFSEATGIFPPSLDDQMNPGQRPVTNWLAAHVQARAAVDAALNPVPLNDIIAPSSVIDAVVRVASAAKFAQADGFITALQVAAIVTLYNLEWA